MESIKSNDSLMRSNRIEDRIPSSTITVALNSKATFLDIDIFSATVNVNPIQPAAATHDTTVDRIAFFGVPRQMISSFGHPSDHTATFAQESVLISHQSSPQQIAHLPFLTYKLTEIRQSFGNHCSLCVQTDGFVYSHVIP